MRTLASIQTIQALEPIPGADSIERARVLGWWLVVKKGEFSVGDRVVYCEIDSYLPETPAFEFLRKNCYKKAITAGDRVLLRAGFRIKTVKLRGQVSQGICFPLNILPEDTWQVGDDVTEALGIVKYEPPVPAHLSGKVKGSFPGYIPKTDETRVQVLGDVLARHAGKTLYVTEKLDGSSCTIFVTATQRGVCSRNLWLDETDENLTIGKLCTELELFHRMDALSARTGRWYAVQGELVGPGIQKNLYGLTAPAIFVFNVLAIDPRGTPAALVEHAEMVDVAGELRLATVPQLGTIVLEHSVDELVEMSRGRSVLNPGVHREGIVLRPPVEEQDPDLGRLSFKAINPDFLLKYED